MCCRFLRRRYQVIACIIFLQIIVGVVYFTSKRSPYSSNTVIGRLKNDAEGQPEAGILYLEDDSTLEPFSWYGKNFCHTEGHISEGSSENACLCKDGWDGKYCAIPHELHTLKWAADPQFTAGLLFKKRPRRIVLVMSDFFHDFRVLEINLKLLGDLIDVVVVSEDETLYAYRNETLLSSFKLGFLNDMHEKFVYVNITNLSNESQLEKMQYTLSEGLNLISNLRTDDLLLIATPEFIFNRKFIIFLKLFHNYPLPIHCSMEKFLYGLHWRYPNTNLANDSSNDKISYESLLPKDSSKNKTETSTDIGTGKRRINNRVAIGKFAEDLQLGLADSSWPYTCAISIHLFGLVFENHLDKLAHEELLFKSIHLELFDSVQQPVFPWKFPASGWSCHLCGSERHIYFKLKRMPAEFAAKWFTGNSYEQNIKFIHDLKNTGKDELMVQADPINANAADPLDLSSLNVDNKQIIMKYLLQ